MAMREECKNFQSRTYSSGEVARFCQLDLAPEAPWRCPDDCASYVRRLADVGWQHGTLIEPRLKDKPDVPSEDIISVLSAAEEAVNDVAAEVLAQFRQEQEKKNAKRWKRKRR
jgi:hypothetical protein